MIANGFHRLTEGFELLQRLAVVEERLSGIRAQHRRALAEVSEAHSTQIQSGRVAAYHCTDVCHRATRRCRTANSVRKWAPRGSHILTLLRAVATL
jgi:hypothetical protein